MKSTMMPAPKRAGTKTSKREALTRLRIALMQISGDERALRAVDTAVSVMACRSRNRLAPIQLD